MFRKLLKKRIALLSLSIGPALEENWQSGSYNITLWILGVVFDFSYNWFSGGRRSVCFMLGAFVWTSRIHTRTFAWSKK